MFSLLSCFERKPNNEDCTFSCDTAIINLNFVTGNDELSFQLFLLFSD